MLNPTTEELRSHCIQFLEKTPQQRLQVLKNIGLARYDFLTKLPLTEANIACLMRFLGNRQQVKFPNLRGADLSGLILDGVNFIRGDLTGANLRGSRLVNGDLLFANFTGADLRDADLTGATLNETIWTGALVEGCQFGAGIGITEEQYRALKNSGARFDRMR